MSWLIDTCVISELAKPAPNKSVVAWIRDCPEEDLYLSVITIGEIEKGIAKLAFTARREQLEKWLRDDVADRFHGRLLPVDTAIASRWGAITGASEAKGVPLPVIDSLIAATSLHHNLVIATRNTADLERCGARCIDPWRD